MRKVSLGLLALAMAATACAAETTSTTPGDGGTTSFQGTGTPVSTCAADELELITPGTLTIATDNPAFPPWVIDNKPENGKGYEPALAYEIADRLGFDAGDVTWIVVPFNNSYAPGPKDFDFDINNVSITPEREEVVDFSDGYYDMTQALLVLKGSPLEDATTMAEVKDGSYGAQIGTTSLTFINTVIQPTTDPSVYETTNDAKAALRNGDIDGLDPRPPDGLLRGDHQHPERLPGGAVPTRGGGARHPVREGQPARRLREPGARRHRGRRDLAGAPGPLALRLPGGSRHRVTSAASDRGSKLLGQRPFLISTASTVIFFTAIVLIVVLAPGFETVRESFFNAQAMREAFVGVPEQGLPSVGEAFLLNVKIFLIAEVLILIFGLVIAVIRQIPGPAFFPIRLVAIVYTDLFRGTPLLLVIYIFGFGVPALEIAGLSDQDRLVYGTVALVLSYSAYVAEVYRAGIESIHPSQAAAARSLGLTRWQSLRSVVLPQAVRRVIPPLLNDFVSLQKDTALLAVLGVVEAARAAQIYSAYRFNYSSFTVAAILFILVTIPLARFTDHLLARDARRRAATGAP